MSHRAERHWVARDLSRGCNALDSLRIMTFTEIERLNGHALTDKERRYLRQRSEHIDRMIRDIRKLSWRLRRSG
jgi:5-bromo-4-chloroindolyl phosphate hydrolysis protein